MSAYTSGERPSVVDPADVIYARRAVRSYQADVVDEVRIRALLDAAVHAPTAMHQEPWRFIVVQNRELLKRISDRAKGMVLSEAAHHGNLLKSPGAAGDGIASVLADPAFNIFYDAGTLIIIGGADERRRVRRLLARRGESDARGVRGWIGHMRHRIRRGRAERAGHQGGAGHPRLYSSVRADHRRC